MTQFVCWVLFPLVLAVLSLGCGLLLERGTGLALPEGLVLPSGLALIIVVAEITTKSSATADLTTPLVVALAVIGLAIARPWRRGRRLKRWPAIAALAVYFVYLAPVLLSGEPTFTGYIKLDDTATWMAMTDRVLSFGHDLSGLAPSTYEVTLHGYLTGGEPVGAMLPWGIGHQLVGQDLAWLFQPYLAFLGAMLALAAWAVIGPLVRSRPLRALVVFIAAQSALTFGYSLWGGIKEVAAAALLPLIAACAIPVFAGQARIRSFLPLAAASFAMLGVLGYGGAVWLAVPLVAMGLGSLRIWLRNSTRVQLAGFVALAAVLAFALIRGAQNFVNTNGSLTSTQLGNLVARLSPLQLFGIWPAGDFRVNPPRASSLTYVLIGVVIGAAVIGLIAAARTRWWVPALYLAAGAVGVALVSAKGSPWVQGKAFATVSPSVLLIALAGAAVLLEGSRGSWPWERRRRADRLLLGRRLVAVVAGTAIGAGVLSSNVLAYSHVTLAPYGQLAELSQIGQRFAGRGPALINEYEPYAARHFLRTMDAESPSELRYRAIPLLSGLQVPKGGYADLDDFQLGALLIYRTIVIRTSPAASRPPAPYRLVYNGLWYQVWERPASLARPVLDAIPLGSSVDPVGVPVCSAVLRLAREARSGGLLAAASRPRPIVAAVTSPLPAGDSTVAVAARAPGSYEVWLGGSFARRLVTSVDGTQIGSTHEVLNEPGGWTPLGRIRLAAGRHRVTLSYGDATLAPGGAGSGAAGPTFSVGPLALSPPPGNVPITYVRTAQARTLCGKPWDWIEALGP